MGIRITYLFTIIFIYYTVFLPSCKQQQSCFEHTAPLTDNVENYLIVITLFLDFSLSGKGTFFNSHQYFSLLFFSITWFIPPQATHTHTHIHTHTHTLFPPSSFCFQSSTCLVILRKNPFLLFLTSCPLLSYSVLIWLNEILLPPLQMTKV